MKNKDYNIAAIILAAGKGTRMKSSLPKIMHKVGGRSLIGHVLDNLSDIKPKKIITVIGEEMQEVMDEVKEVFPFADLAIQKQRLGTGHAVKQAQGYLEKFNGIILIVYGDTPFIGPEILQKMSEEIARNNADIVVLGFTPGDPAEYGRIITDNKRQIKAIIEYKDADEKQRAVNLCNSGVMAVKGNLLFGLISELRNENAKGEYYLTDIISIGRGKGYNCKIVEADEWEVMGINSQAEKAVAEKILQDRLRKKTLENGISMIAPETVFLQKDTEIKEGSMIHPYVVFGPGVKIGKNVEIKSFSHIENAVIKDGAVIGPFARIRPGTEIGEKARIGNFVEIKNAKLGKGAKVNHLSYVGDASVGKEANLGAGTITCNYDGYAKAFTEIGDNAFIGSNSSLVAPVKIGKGAIIGAGSTIRANVEPDSIAVMEGAQKNLKGKAESYRKKRTKKA